ncbi:MAG: DUF1934 domain-containing protein [Anaerovibrio sp.]|uniref:DUF1934 domain-containing protein n=1 Tax=Anaerovibrio sp. TaxID=1872532 RepID=UPI0025E28520|nr:DUF1934 domain-containing protein [Anaerovibrio sp.]MCR5176614.1 DUF1934 domain-containing protein [Anaerovibrio sp.]
MDIVKICTSGYQKDPEGKCEKVAHLAEGKYYLRNGKHYIKYDDSSMDTDYIIGTTIKIDGSKFRILRNGPIDTDMNFEAGKTTYAVYRTPYSSMKLEIYTRQLDISMDYASGNVELYYDMRVDGTFVGEYELRIEISKVV